jgi:excisionase family DNA binding protein
VFGVDELAIFFGCSTEKIKRLCRKRELPAFKFGKSWYVREQDLEIYINRAIESNLPSQKERE